MQNNSGNFFMLLDPDLAKNRFDITTIFIRITYNDNTYNEKYG